MMYKRVLPFLATFIIGAALGHVANIGKLRLGSHYRACPGSHFFSYVSAPSRFKGVTIPPQILSVQEAKYTNEAYQRGVIGVVRLRVTFDRSGQVTEVVPLTQLPAGLTENAIRAAEGINFIPARSAGVP
ncbi:MAG: energy transducer TonB, partial [Pyrinomonadaceae bacterium]